MGAPTKREALRFADCEWGDPYAGEVQELKHFAMYLQPSLVDGEIDFMVDLGPFGGDPDYHLGPKAYPLIDESCRGSHGGGAIERIDEVFAAELARLREPPDPTEAAMVAGEGGMKQLEEEAPPHAHGACADRRSDAAAARGDESRPEATSKGAELETAIQIGVVR